jgi:hypothetical protein
VSHAKNKIMVEIETKYQGETVLMLAPEAVRYLATPAAFYVVAYQTTWHIYLLIAAECDDDILGLTLVFSVHFVE